VIAPAAEQVGAPVMVVVKPVAALRVTAKLPEAESVPVPAVKETAA